MEPLAARAGLRRPELDAGFKALAANRPPPSNVREVSILVTGGAPPELVYKTASMRSGRMDAVELSYPIGLYRLAPITLDTFDAPVPEPKT